MGVPQLADDTELKDLRRSAEAYLREEPLNVLLREAYKNSTAGRALVTLDHRFAHINDVYCRILKLPREKILRSDWPSLTPEPWRSRDLALVARVVSGEIPGYYLIKQYTTTTDVLILVSGIKSGPDKIAGLDVTCLPLVPGANGASELR